MIAPSNFITGVNSYILAFPEAVVSENEQSIHVVWSLLSDEEGAFRPLGIYYSKADGGGKNWTPPLQLAGEGNTQPNIAIDQSENLHVIWNTEVGKSKRIYVNSPDQGVNWSNPVDIYSYDMEETTAGIQGAPDLIISDDGSVKFLIGTNAGVRFREMVNGELSILDTLESLNDGETWLTRIVKIDGQNYCVYWSAMEAISPGFTIKCQQPFEIKPVSDLDPVSVYPNPSKNTNQAGYVIEENPVVIDQSTRSETLNFSRERETQIFSSFTVILGISVALSLVLILIVVVFNLRKQK